VGCYYFALLLISLYTRRTKVIHEIIAPVIDVDFPASIVPSVTISIFRIRTARVAKYKVVINTLYGVKMFLNNFLIALINF